MPCKTSLNLVYDSGRFVAVMEKALAVADWRGFAGRRRVSESAGKRRGIGMACYVESSGVAPSRFAGMLGARVGFFESAAIRVAPDGAVRAALGTHNHGQGHATTMAQILSERLGVTLGQVEIVEGDTDLVPVGTGTFGSRSIAVGGSALDRAAMKIIAKGKRIAAHLLETSADDLSFCDGRFQVTGTDRHISFAEVARAAYVPHNYPHETLEPGLEETAFYDPTNFAFSNGVHLCEVEVDVETGLVRVVGYYAADDIGTVINPMIVEGQIHGGVAQGLGQGMLEACRYDARGQLLSGSFMDYAVPRADDLPFISSLCDEGQPCTHNPLGAKGCGEAGAIGAPAALVGAVLDALHSLGVDDIEMPLTPERVWRAIRAGG
jgi:carbon-monoxide dehydrogenase large subunit